MISLGVLIVTGVDGRWHPGIGDPTFVGWLTVVAYLVAGWLCWRAAALARGAAGELAQSAPERAHQERLLFWLWALSALAMFLLGLNKQLDLQSWLTQVARDMAYSEGWYERRRNVQAGFIWLTFVVGVVSTLVVGYLLRSVRERALGTVVGLGVLVSFVIIRAASFHNVDILINTRVFSLRMNWILELSGICIVGIATYRAARRYSGARPLP